MIEYIRCSLPVRERNARGEAITVHCTMIAGHEGRCGFAISMIITIREQAAKLGKLDARRIA